MTSGDSGIVFVTLADAAPNVPVWDDGALRRASDRALPGAGVGWVASDSGIIAAVPTLVGGGSVATYAASATEDNGTPARLVRVDTRAEGPPVLIVADSAARSMVVADSSGRIAGPSLEAPLARFAHALSMQDFRVWFAALPAPSPKLITRRSVRARVRALAPEPGASARFRGDVLKVFRAAAHDGSDIPGTVLSVGGQGFLVACGRRAMAPIEVAPAGRKRMSAAEFVRGYRPEVGERLS